jgi:hypothetical protein
MLAWTAMMAKKKLAFGSVYMPLLWTNQSSIFFFFGLAARDMQLDVKKMIKNLYSILVKEGIMGWLKGVDFVGLLVAICCTFNGFCEWNWS